MRRAELEHVLRAAGAVADETALVVIGSQALLGSFAEPPEDLTVSMEADLYPEAAPDKALLIDGSIGEGSPFHETFGYYAHGVGPETATLVAGWRARAAVVANENTGGVRGICLGPEDLALSKLAAGRDKDLAFVRSMLRHGLVAVAGLAALLPGLPEPARNLVSTRLERLQ